MLVETLRGRYRGRFRADMRDRPCFLPAPGTPTGCRACPISGIKPVRCPPQRGPFFFPLAKREGMEHRVAHQSSVCRTLSRRCGRLPALHQWRLCGAGPRFRILAVGVPCFHRTGPAAFRQRAPRGGHSAPERCPGPARARKAAFASARGRHPSPASHSALQDAPRGGEVKL